MSEAEAAIADGGAAPHRTLLLVDDEENIISAMKRLLRREGYTILSANGGETGLALLAGNPVDVIVSDQRMPVMTGVEFLRRAKTLRPDTIRIVLSGYTELQSITNAINEGAIYKFLTKPWDDEQLKAQIAEAFRQKELSDENQRLAREVQRANRDLAEANTRLQTLLDEKERRISRDETALGVLHEVLELLPWPLLGVDGGGLIVTMNARAEALFGDQGSLLGQPATTILPAEPVAALLDAPPAVAELQHRGVRYRARSHPLGHASAGRGNAIVLIESEEPSDA